MEAPTPPQDPASLSWSDRAARFAVLQGARPRALGVLGGLSVGDFFLPALPTQTSVLALGLMQPHRIYWIVGVFSLATALGAALLALVLLNLGAHAHQWGLQQFGPDWTHTLQRVQEWGLWLVCLASISSSPARLTVAATLLSGVAAAYVVGVVLVGRSIYLTLFLLLITRAPIGLSACRCWGPLFKSFRRLRPRCWPRKGLQMAGTTAPEASPDLWQSPRHELSDP